MGKRRHSNEASLMKSAVVLAMAFTILLLPTTLAIWPWDECNSPHYSFSSGGSTSGWIDVFWDRDDWAKVDISTPGKYRAWLTGPGNADFDLEVYSSCSGSPVCSSYKSGSNEYCYFNVTSSKTYKLRAYAYSGSGDWRMGAYFVEPICNSHSYSACYNNDRYWYDSCGIIEAEAILIGAAHQIAALQIQARNMSYTRIAAILVMARGAATIAQTIM
ncbi:MAG: PPC domain-containing protein [Candidatus Diapherotrites archaeon]|uniref:PPC domain-containing protein n=1 Tax=Candidatus Iainarchaeum sp. TaxID=3101447 RepID=A0A8T4KVH7_9ARCH|nr:PPC domain-containing protein [Candidatus Diapherotrites archaeon]